ncbi:MAG: DUF3793 family protein [Enterocloster asparagiformis]|nr:DUF3793 family protein [Enterocloster asparagiformis]
MSSEAIRLAAALNRNEVEIQIGLQCAPLLTGIKASNLLSVNRRQKRAVPHLLCSTGISCRVLCECGGRVTFFLFRHEMLEAYLNRPEVQELMEAFGYQGAGLTEILGTVAERYSGYMKRREPFPHEVGLLLGYPAADVAGFILHGGKNFLYSGYWKVYENLQERLQIFEEYDRAKERVVRMIAAGADVRRILRAHRALSHKQQMAV